MKSLYFLMVFLGATQLQASAQEVVDVQEQQGVPQVQALPLTSMPAIHRGFVREEGDTFTFHVMAKAPTKRDCYGVASLKNVANDQELIKIFEMPRADLRIGRTSFAGLDHSSNYQLKIGYARGAPPTSIEGWGNVLSANDIQINWGTIADRPITTPPAVASNVASFVFGSCNRFVKIGPMTFMVGKGSRMFQAMADDIAQYAAVGFATDAVVTLGDWVYNDPLIWGIGEKKTFEEIASLYDLTNTTTGAKALLQSGPPLYQVWDDHERYNDVTGEIPDRKRAQADAGKRAYDLYQRPQGAATPHNWYHIDGNIDGFVMDLRSELLPSQSLAVSQDQFDALEAYLLDPVRADRLKPVFMSTTALCLQGDAWSASRAQLRRLMEIIRDNNIRGVVICAGDIHVGVSGIWQFGDDNHGPHVLEVASSAFHKISHNKDALLRPRADLGDGLVLNAVGGLSHTTTEDNYTRMILNHADMSVRIIRKDPHDNLLEDLVCNMETGTLQDTDGSNALYRRSPAD